MNLKKITKKKLVIILLITLILIASSIPLLFLMKNKETHHEVVTTYVVQKQPPFVFQGVVVPSKTQKEFYDSNINKLNSVNVTSGQEVKEGDILFSYKIANSDITSLEYALKRAELDISSSQDSLITLQEKGNRLIEKINSYSSLSSNQSEINDTGKQALLTEIETNNEQIRQTEQQLSRAYLAYDEAQENLDNAYNGQIVEIFAKQNGKVILYDEYTENKPLLEVISFDSKVQAKVSEFDYPKLEMEEEVKIKTLNNEFETLGTIQNISSLPIENATSSIAFYEFEVVPQTNLPFGYRVQISKDNNSILIPKKSVIDDTVFLKQKNGKFKSVKITYTEENGFIKVLSGLNYNDEIAENAEDVNTIE